MRNIWAVLLCLLAGYALAREADTDDLTSDYYRSLMLPDSPRESCCGEGDVYWADSTDTDPATGDLVAIITDTRDDTIRTKDGRIINRAHVPVGTRIVVPKNKIRKPPIFNPTGHTIIFLRVHSYEFTRYEGPIVLCYEPQPGM